MTYAQADQLIQALGEYIDARMIAGQTDPGPLLACATAMLRRQFVEASQDPSPWVKYR